MPSYMVEVEMNLAGSGIPGGPGRDGTNGANGLPGSSGLTSWFDVISAGAVGDGTTDDFTEIAAANSAAHAKGGIVYFPAGYSFKYTSQLAVTSPNVSWVFGPGVKMLQSFDGVGIKWNLGPFSGLPPVMSGGIYGFPIIDGTSAGPNSVGLEYGDAVDGHMEVVVQNFSGASAIGIWVNTRTNYTEGTWWDAIVSNCQYGMVFDVQPAAASKSHGYLTLARVRCGAVNNGQFGVVVKNGALLYNGQFNILGNLAPGGTFIDVIGDGVSSTGIFGLLDLRAEQTTGSPGAATGITISNFGVIQGSGVVDLSSNLLQSSIVSGQGAFVVTGKVAAPGLAWNGEPVALIGGSSWGIHGGTTPAFTNSWVQDGASVQFWQDSSGCVNLQGAVKNGTAATSAFTLPSGYRPAQQVTFAVPCAFGASVGVVTVGTSGTVTCPNATQTSLSGIRFQPVLG